MRPTPLIFCSLAAANVVRLDFDVNRGKTFDSANKLNKRQLVKRDDAAEVKLINDQTFYAVDIQIGEEKQNVSVQIDTGSADLWVMAASNPYCEPSSKSKHPLLEGSKARIGNRLVMREDATLTASDAYPTDWNRWEALLSSALDEVSMAETMMTGPSMSEMMMTPTTGAIDAKPTMDCQEYGTFDIDSSFENNNTKFLIQYADYSYAYGDFGTDDVVIGGITVNDLSFAVANYSNSSMGVMGIGLKETEATYMGALQENFTYENLPLRMVSQGLIHKNAYSLYLNPDNSSGTVLFGGVDHSMYSGKLQTVMVINQYAEEGITTPVSLDITLSSISYVDSKGSSDTVMSYNYPAILDSGTTSVYAPEDVIDTMADIIGAKFSDSLGVYTMKCSDFKDEYFTFNFTGAQLNVPLSELMIDVSDEEEGQCALGVFDGGDDSFILGDSVMRSAYVVYDLDNLEVSVAQAKSGASDSDIEVISSSVPSAVKAPQYSATWSPQSGGTASGGSSPTTMTSVVSSKSSTTASATSTGKPKSPASKNFAITHLSAAVLVLSVLLCL